MENQNTNKISYGPPLMKKLILEAQFFGIKVSSPGRDLMTGLWMVILDGEIITFPSKAGASGACCFVQGLIRGAKQHVSAHLLMHNKM